MESEPVDRSQDDEEDQVQPDLPPESSQAGFHREEVFSFALIVITEPAENRKVEIHHVEHSSGVDSCRRLVEDVGQGWFHYAVWNRTGMVECHEFPVAYSDIDEAFTVSLELPNDPPYIIQPVYCNPSMILYVDFYAHKYFEAVQSREPWPNERDLETYPPLNERDTLSYDVLIPRGSSKGVGTISVEGDVYFIESSPIINQRDGHSFGEYHFYDSEQSDDNWTVWREYTPMGIDIDHKRIVMHVKPGDYELHVNLSTVAPFDTVWKAEHRIYRFNENVTQYGFEYPFENYVH